MVDFDVDVDGRARAYSKARFVPLSLRVSGTWAPDLVEARVQDFKRLSAGEVCAPSVALSSQVALAISIGSGIYRHFIAMITLHKHADAGRRTCTYLCAAAQSE